VSAVTGGLGPRQVSPLSCGIVVPRTTKRRRRRAPSAHFTWQYARGVATQSALESKPHHRA
jgi:hypothetical protein